jgi:molybdopterin-guanine dinucleotide biosynthesis protein A
MIMSLRSRLLQFQSETFFITTGLPGIVGPMATLNTAVDGFRTLQISGNAFKKSAVVACDCARSVCKPVDDLFKRPNSTFAYKPYHTYGQPHYAPVQYSSYGMIGMPPMLDHSADFPIPNG